MGFTSRALRIDPDERRVTGLVAGLMFVSLAVAAIGESGVNALFFDRVGTHALPLMYLAQAGATLVAMFVLTAVLERSSHRSVYLWSPLILAAVVLAERGVLETDARWIYPVLWITVAFATLAQAIGLWGIAGSAVDTRQAKRLFPIFGAGGILGSVVGGLLTRPLAAAVGTEDLLLVWVGGLLLAGALCRLSLGPKDETVRGIGSRVQRSLWKDLRRGLDSVRRSELLTAMAAAAVLFSVLFYSLYLPFAKVSTERFSDPAELAGFFGLVWATITGAAFLVSLLVTNKLLARFGVAAMVLVLPLLYLGSFAILLVGSGFVTIVVLRVTTGVWLQGVASPAWETLVNVIPEDRRDQTRAFLNGGPSQVGTAIAGLVALIGQAVLSGRQLAAIGLVAALLTLVAARAIKRSYADALLDALLAARPQVFERASAWTPVALPVDAEAADVLRRAMGSADLGRRRAAFELAAELRTDALADEVAGGLGDADPIVRRAAVRGLDPSSPSGRGALLRMTEDLDPGVAGVAAARALPIAGDLARSVLERLLRHSDHAVRRTVLEQLLSFPVAEVTGLVETLLDDPAPEVRAAAFDVLAEAGPERALGPALERIHDRDRSVRLAAGRALGRSGPAVVPDVLSALGDPRTYEAGVEAARLIDLDGDVADLDRFVRAATARTASDRAIVAAIPHDDPLDDLLRDAILERGRRVARSALWALSMLGPRRNAMRSAIERLDGPPPLRANALETLETATGSRSTGPLLAMWEPISRHEDDGRWLTMTLQDDDELVRGCAELIRARREGVTMTRSPSTTSVIERALIIRQVPLFSELAPADLERIARIAEEHGYADGEAIARQGELGEELHVVTSGTIRVVTDRGGREHEIARRSAGEVVGEMSIFTRSPRIASLVADGVVRTIRIGHADFESMVRERPELALGVMRVLALRLADSTRAGARTDD